MCEIIKMTATELAAKIKSKELSSVEVTKAFLGRIKEVDPKIKAYVSICEDYALKQAQISDDKIAKCENVGVLEGVPIAIKDNILIKDIKMTAASKILENYIAPYDATVIAKLKNAEFSVDDPIANSSRFALPTKTAPAFLSFVITVAS